MKPRLAIIGSGIAGLGCAYLLNDSFELTIYEQNDYVGGHTNTITVNEKSAECGTRFDTGFMVFNYATYPLLTRLFAALDVPVKKTDMSFSVQHLADNIEWNGAGLSKIFAQRKNLVNPRFWRMLKRLDWFNKNAPHHSRSGQTVREYVKANNLGEDFLQWYLIPMAASVWSTPPSLIFDFPIAFLIRFFHNHGFLGLDTHYQWYTVDGGAGRYVDRLLAALSSAVLLKDKVSAVIRADDNSQVSVVSASGVKQFDKVILACHADEALALLMSPTKLQDELLSKFSYQKNDITVHSDSGVMPSCRQAWASWNYRVGEINGTGPESGTNSGAATLHYWMNSLQGLKGKDYFVSLNSDDIINQSLVHRRMQYTHPIFDLATEAAQPRLFELNHEAAVAGHNIYFCGSYFHNGFHEDAFRSAVEAASAVKGRAAF
jgi:predicted NAD/FAD-binding protein